MAVFTDPVLEGYFKRIANATHSLCGLSGTLTLKQIHTALLSKSGLSRKTTPVTPGDYLKGIAVCARKINGRSDYLTGSCTLAEIATCLENPVETDGGGNTQNGVTVTLYSSGELSVEESDVIIDYYDVSLRNEWGEINSYSALYGTSNDFSGDLAANGECWAVVTVHTHSGDIFTITSNTVNFM